MEKNKNYQPSVLEVKEAFEYPQLLLEKGKPIYTQFEEDPDKFRFVTRPDLFSDIWESF